MTREAADEGDPRSLYERQSKAAQTQANLWSARERWLSHSRLVVFLVGLVLGWLIFGTHQLELIWILPVGLIFPALLIIHDRSIRKRQNAEKVVDFFERGLSRLDHAWAGQGNSGQAHVDPAHPYANDLDLFGTGSLFELICTTRTREGEKVLAQWLLEPTTAETARERQEAVRELTERVALRRDLWLLGRDANSTLATTTDLPSWATTPRVLNSGLLRWAAIGLSSLTALSALLWFQSDAGVLPLVLAIALQSAFALALRPRVSRIIHSAEAPSQELTVLSGLLSLIEAEPVESKRLVELRNSLEIDGAPPSSRIKELRRLMDLLDARRNQFFAPIGALLLWGTQIAISLEAWRSRCGSGLEGWIAAAAEIEALCALAGYAYENPTHAYPELLDQGPCFEGTGLGHPLIAPDQCVRNDLSLGGSCRAYMMSGSNMSGKSTMLRTVGCSAILAMAGAPVRATSLRLSPLQIAASIRINDSLQQGVSHFLAEVQRLRQVVDLASSEPPALFLLDEVLQGTNSHDRRIGADALVLGLLNRGAIGIVTTHDLALAQIAEQAAGQIENVHFEDQIVDGRMVFDYRLRKGIVTRSNALELMRSVGLDV